MATVLVVDDEPGILGFTRRALESEGHSVLTSSDGADGLRLAIERDPDLVVLDLAMPGLSGAAVLAALVEDSSHRRVMVISAVGEVKARVRCLDAGAVDFLPKPFDISEFLARVRLRLRQSPQSDGSPHGSGEQLVYGSVTLNLRTRRLSSALRDVELPQREFALMEHLMRNRGQVCTRTELLSQVWGFAFDPGSNVVDVTVARLRAKIDGLQIETVRNVGYALQTA